ncbi:MAG: glycosyltransferase family 39 protein [Anaerolineales bacterium]|nr:glycosyltransferase family 39 protein [Anaerolineales bacterium]
MPTKIINMSEFIGVSGLTLLAFALRVYGLGAPSLWYDELLELDVAQSPFWEIGPQLVRHAAMPLDYYLLYGWLLLGRQEAWVRFPALIFGVLAVPLTYKLAKSLFNKNVGYLAAFFLAWSSLAVYYSQDVRPYAMLVFWILLSFWGLWRAYQTRRDHYWLIVGVGLTGASLSHYFALFLLLPIGLFVGVQQLFHLRDKQFWQYTIYFIICLMVLVIVFAFNGRLRDLYNVGGRFSTVVVQPETLTVPAAEKPNRGAGPPRHFGFVWDTVLIPFSSAEPLSLLAYLGLLLISLLSLWPSKRYGASLLVLSWLILPIVLIYLFLLQRGTFFAVRYILYSLPAYLILIAYGVEFVIHALNSWRRRLIPGPNSRSTPSLLPGSLLVTITIFLIFGEVKELLVLYRADSREDWRAVGQLLQNNARPDDAVIAVRAEPAINWYYPAAHAPFGTYNTSQPIWEAMRGRSRRWFVLSSYSYRVDEGLRNWLKANGAVTIAIDRRVVVHLQQEGVSAGELLAQVRTFALPQKALTYATLADQLKAQGDLETSRIFYERAIELAETPSQRVDYESRLATLAMSLQY